MLKFAGIDTDLKNLGVKDNTLLRFSRRFEAKIKPMRENLTQELRASNDPDTTMRAWIRVNLLNPLIEKFTSPSLDDQFVPNNKSMLIMQAHNTTREQVAARKRESAIMWAQTLSRADYVNFPEFSYTMLRGIADRFDVKTSSTANVPDNGLVGSVLTHFLETADQAAERVEGNSSGGVDPGFSDELAEASRQVALATSALQQLDSQKPQADQVSAETMNAWRQTRQQLEHDLDIAKRRDRLLGARFSLTGQDLYELYVVESADKNKQQEKVVEETVGRWKQVPQVGQTNEEFPDENSKITWLHKMFMGGRVCIKERWGYETYAKSGPIWVLLDQSGARGLAAIAFQGNKCFHMENRENSEPQEYVDEISAFMKIHPEYKYDNEEMQTGRRHISLIRWVEETSIANKMLDDPAQCISVAFSNHPKSSIAMAKLVNWNEGRWNRFVKPWLLNKLHGNDEDVESGLSAIHQLLVHGQRTYQAFKSVIDALGDLIDRKLPIIPAYLEYVRMKGERRPAFEEKMNMNALNRANVLAAQARAFNGITAEIKEEILKHEGVFHEYMYHPDAPAFKGPELVGFVASFRNNPQRALDVILKMHRAHINPSGIAPILIPYLKLDPHAAATYAVYILQGRFIEGEAAISRDKGATAQYAAMLLHNFQNQIFRMKLPKPIMDAAQDLYEHRWNRDERELEHVQ